MINIFFFLFSSPAKFIWSLCGKTKYRVRETVLMPFNSNVKSIYILKWQEKKHHCKLVIDVLK